MNWVSRNIEPKRAKKVRVIATLAAVNRRFWKNRTSSIGWSDRSCHQTKLPSAAMARMNAPTTGVAVQPFVGASMIAQTKDTRPTMDSAAPSRSSFGLFSARELGSRK